MFSAENRLAPDSEQTGTVEVQRPNLNLDPCLDEAPDGWRECLSTEDTLLAPFMVEEADYWLDQDVSTLLCIGMDYAKAAIDGEPYLMGDAWLEARRHVARLKAETGETAKECKPAYALRAANLKVRPQRVYFIAAENGPIKIGIAQDPEARLRSLQTSHHARLSILATCSGGAMKEKAYHARFAAHRLSGEWFARVPEIEAEVAKLQPSSPHAPSS